MDIKSDMHGTNVPLDDLSRKLDVILHEIRSIRADLPIKQTYTIMDISRMLGVAQSTLYKKCWNLPNYGRSDIGGNPRRWLRSTVEAWFSIPEDERMARWEAMTEEERR